MTGANRNYIKKQLSLITSIVILWIIVVILLVISVKKNQGHIVYAIDDTYIHMAIAKNLAQNGVWGITKYGFSSSSSSLLYTLLISVIYFITGVNEVAPFILNIIFATLTIFLVFIILRRYNLNSCWSFIILLSVIFFTPLPALIFSWHGAYAADTSYNFLCLFFSYYTFKRKTCLFRIFPSPNISIFHNCHTI